jgi:hypothetical protein
MTGLQRLAGRVWRSAGRGTAALDSLPAAEAQVKAMVGTTAKVTAKVKAKVNAGPRRSRSSPPTIAAGKPGRQTRLLYLSGEIARLVHVPSRLLLMRIL